MAAIVTSVNVGASRPLQLRNKTVLSGIYKEPIAGAVRIGRLGLVGDTQVDRRYHGGPDKAVNVYSVEHYPYWSERLGQTLTAGAFGENLTIQGLTESEVAIGDIYRVGEAVLQVTQPRQPCHKLSAKHDEPMLVKWVEQSGRTGFYLRCLEPGNVQAEDRWELAERCDPQFTISNCNRLRSDPLAHQTAVQQLLAIPALSEAWRTELAAGLCKQ